MLGYRTNSQHDQENAPPEGQGAASRRDPPRQAANGGGGKPVKPVKPASSFGQPSNGRTNSAGGGASSTGGDPQERGGGTSGVEAGTETDNKELMHVLESTLITWTKQIKNVLKQVTVGAAGVG